MKTIALFVGSIMALTACKQGSQPDSTKAPATDQSPSTTAEAKANSAEAKSTAQKFGGAFKLDAPEKLSSAITRLRAQKPSSDAKDKAAAADDASCSEAEVESCSGIVANHDGETVRVSGTVGSVCKKAGCWMVLEEGGQQVRVFTKEHGFFLPKDCEGRAADVEGKLRSKTISEGFAKHLAEDGGEDPSKVQGAQREYLMTATAITLL